MEQTKNKVDTSTECPSELIERLEARVMELEAALAKEKAGMTAEYCDGCWTVLKLKEQIRSLSQYFTSGNSIPVERATILAKDFWQIVGSP